MKRTLFTILVMLLVFSIYWMGGGDFERGSALASTAYLAFCLGGIIYFLPVW